jgi:Phospholipase_D-nuclease N-terminal
MSKNKKILIGIFSILPLLLFVIYMVSMVSFFIYFFNETAVQGKDPEDFFYAGFGNMAGMIVTMVLLGLLSLAVMVYFLVHAINNQSLNRDERLVWILVFIFVGMVTFPIYWYMRIWQTPEVLNTT